MRLRAFLILPAFLILLLTGSGSAQPFSPAEFEGRPGLRLSNTKLQATILSQGGPIVELRLSDDPDQINPLWNPVRFAREGGQTPRPPQGTSFGHFVCVDGFGPVSPEERQAGLPNHGEAHRITWEEVSQSRHGSTSSLKFSMRLPIVQEVLTRAIELVDGENVVYVESELESLLGFDRPVNWAEHATIGSPFLEPGKTVVDTSAGPCRTRAYDAGAPRLPYRLASFQDFLWPLAPAANGRLLDLRAAPLEPNSGDHTTCLLDPNRRLVFVTALHPEKRLLLGYLFRREEYPWLQNWENYPAAGRMARGLEFGTQPFDVPRREAISTGSSFGAPTYRWLPAKSKIRSRFLLFYARTPAGMLGVSDVRLEDGRLRIHDNRSGAQLTLPASLPL
jgi:hypothetical protein